MNPTFASGIYSSMPLGIVVDSSVSTFETAILALFSMSLATFFYETMGLVLLLPLFMMHIATFSSESPELSLVLVPPHRIFDDPSFGPFLSSTKGSAPAPFAFGFCDRTGQEAILALLFTLWLSTSLDGFVVGAKSQLIGNDGRERTYPGLSNDSLRLGGVSNLSSRFGMNLVRGEPDQRTFWRSMQLF